jgi:hypothetical protein
MTANTIDPSTFLATYRMRSKGVMHFGPLAERGYVE